MSLGARIVGAVQRRCRRVYYERIRPEMPVSEIYAALAPGLNVDLLAPDGFRQLWSAQLARTPGALWSVMPPATAGTVAQAMRGESRLLTRSIRVTPTTDWHGDPFHLVRWPGVHVESCPYRVPGGDLVLLWHLNRMSYLVDLTAAYRTSGETMLADRVHALMASWSQANPYLVGANWISPMETGLRLVAWSMSLAGTTGAPVPDEERCELVLRSVIRQAGFLASHFSRWAIPNNHLIGEAATLSAVAAYWPIFGAAAAWMEQAEATLVEEARRQVLGDGFHFENSVNYHLVVLDYFLVYLHAKLLQGSAPNPVILERTRVLADAALAMVSPGGRMPMIGDDSMPNFVVIGGTMGSPGPVAARVTFEDFLRVEHARLFMTTPWGRELLALGQPVVHARRFEEAGIDVSRDQHSHVVFTHGPQHRHPFSRGHLHADAGSFELELDGTPVLVDSGTCLYDGEPGLRDHMRSARAHNAVIIDGVEPMKPAAAFEWQSLSRAEALGFGAVGDVTAAGCRQHLPALQGAGVDHVRALVRVGSTVIIVDALSPQKDTSPATHRAAVYFHTPVLPGSAARDGHLVRLTDAAEFARVFEVLDEPRATVDLIASPADRASLYSPSYGESRAGTTICVSVEVQQVVMLVSVLRRPETTVKRTDTHAGQMGFSVSDGHRTRIVRLCLDPFAVHVGGRAVTGVVAGARIRPGAVRDSMEWLDELDARPS